MATAVRTVEELIADLKTFFHPDPARLAQAHAFDEALFYGREPARFLCGLPGDPAPGHTEKSFNHAEQFHDRRKMFYEHFRSMVAVARGGRGFAVPRLRANLGTGFIASTFGVDQLIFDDKMPWPQGHISKEELSRLDPAEFESVADKGLVPRALEIYDYYYRELGTHAYSFVPDTQGVLDIAHLVRGDEIFFDPFDDPPFMHHLMECCCRAFIAVTKCIKNAINEPMTSGNHGGMSLCNGGTRYCMDTSVLFSRAMVEEFERPYLEQALGAFGGGYVHFCGYAPHLTELLCDVPLVRAINPNYMDSRPYDYDRDLQLMQDADKAFFGAPFKCAGESLDQYFDRVLRPLRQPGGLRFGPRGEGMAEYTADDIESAWNAAVERRFV